jgi:hypothetical protein
MTPSADIDAHQHADSAFLNFESNLQGERHKLPSHHHEGCEDRGINQSLRKSEEHLR